MFVLAEGNIIFIARAMQLSQAVGDDARLYLTFQIII